MTCIIGVEWEDADGNKRVSMGADSEVCHGWTRNSLSSRKIAKHRNVLIGVSGELRTINLIQHHLQLPAPDTDETDTHYVMVTVINAIRQCLKDNAWVMVKDSQESSEGNSFIIGYHGRVYRVGPDFGAAHYDSGIVAIGSEEYALGAIHALRAFQSSQYTEIEIRNQIETALRVSAQLTMGVAEPFYVEVL